MKLNHDTMICEKPKSTLKNNFSPSFHVLYTSVFLFWVLNKPESNRVNAFFSFISKNLLFFTLREKKISPSRQKLSKLWLFKVLTFEKVRDREHRTKIELFN